MSEYELAKSARDALEKETERLSRALRSFPRGPTGLTPDSVKASPEFKQAKAAYLAAFARLRNANASITRLFKNEMRAERKC